MNVAWTSFGTLDSSEKTIAILGDEWRPQTAKQGGGKISKTNYQVCHGYVMDKT